MTSGVVQAGGPASGALGYHEAMASPCQSCAATPCCTYLPLDSFRVTSLASLDYAAYLLNFDSIEIGVTQQGDWSAYYIQPCRHLDGDGGCSLHGTPEQPHICVQYNPYACWYRRVLSGPNEEYVRIDPTRLQWIIQRTTFDDQRQITELPTWAELVEIAHQAPLPKVDFHASDGAQGAPSAAGAPVGVTDADREPDLQVSPAGAPEYDPCTGCAAHCCRSLIFDVPAPQTAAKLDYLRFALGFPGVEVGVTDDQQWVLVIRTSCAHLEGNRCGIFGRWDRPLRCQFFDAWACGYLELFEPRAEHPALTFTFDDFPTVAAMLPHDERGEIAEIPETAALARALEEARGHGVPARVYASGRTLLPLAD